MSKYKHGKQTTPIDFEDFKKIMDEGKFVRPSHRSLLAFLYWTGVRQSEALERVMPHHYPHFFRLNRAVNFLNDPTTTTPEMLAWFGWRNIATINRYLGYSKRHLDKQAQRLRKELQG